MEIIYLNDKVKAAYATPGSAAFDLHACFMGNESAVICINPGETKVIPSGTKINIDNKSIAALVLPRSGKSINHLVVANSPGLIDSDFQGEIGIIAHNNGNEPIFINKYERIAQLMFVQVIHPKLVEVEEFSAHTKRGAGGFGHTGS